jgi:hypothetical protein
VALCFKRRHRRLDLGDELLEREQPRQKLILGAPRGPLRVIAHHILLLATRSACPLCSESDRLPSSCKSVAKCKERTYAAQQTTPYSITIEAQGLALSLRSLATLGEGEESGSAQPSSAKPKRIGAGNNAPSRNVKRRNPRNIEAKVLDLTAIAVIAAASFIFAISSGHIYFAAVFAAQAVAAAVNAPR